MTPRQKALCVSCCSLIVIILIFFWVRIGLMGCSCPKQFEICEDDRRRLQTTGGSNNECSTECLCDGNFFTCEYTCALAAAAAAAGTPSPASLTNCPKQVAAGARTDHGEATKSKRAARSNTAARPLATARTSGMHRTRIGPNNLLLQWQ